MIAHERTQDPTQITHGQEWPQDESAHASQADWEREGECREDIEVQARTYGSESAAMDNAVRKWLGIYREDRGVDELRPDGDVYGGGE